MKLLQAKFNVNFKILPFGHMSFVIKSNKEIDELIPAQLAIYTEQKTTNIKTTEIIFGDDNYVVPKTTSGLL